MAANSEPKVKRIGIFGGSFNPIHQGHVRLALSVCLTGAVDAVWFMVSPLNPLKQQGGGAALLEGNYADRLAMARLATQEFPQLEVTDFERTLPRPSYTWSTLQALQKQYPQHEFCLMMGQDNWDHFDRWYHAEDLLSAVDMIVYGRPGSSALPSAGSPLGGGVSLWDHTCRTLRPLESDTPFPLFDVSSTDVRHAFATADRRFLARWLHPAVEAYCRAHSLYGSR